MLQCDQRARPMSVTEAASLDLNRGKLRVTPAIFGITSKYFWIQNCCIWGIRLHIASTSCTTRNAFSHVRHHILTGIFLVVLNANNVTSFSRKVFHTSNFWIWNSGLNRLKVQKIVFTERLFENSNLWNSKNKTLKLSKLIAI